ncbi:7234_t:CDS:2, partial [Racocetra persica]
CESIIDPAQNSSILEHDLNKLVIKSFFVENHSEDELFLLFKNIAKYYSLVEYENNLMIWYEGVIDPVQNSKLVTEKFRLDFFVENSTECNHLVEQDNSLTIEYKNAQNEEQKVAKKRVNQYARLVGFCLCHKQVKIDDDEIVH